MAGGIKLTAPRAGPALAGNRRRARDAELEDLRDQLRDARETLDAIQFGAVDALVLGSPGEERVFALAGADRPYRLLVEAMHEGAATIAESGILLYANARLGELAGRAVADMVATPALGLVAEADRPALARLLTVEVGEHARAEFDLAGRDPPARVLISVVGFELDGALLRSLVATDLTERRRSEAELSLAQEKSRLSETEMRRLSNAIEQSADAVVITSAAREIEYVNSAFERITGYTRGEVLGRNPRLLKSGVHPPEFWAGMWAALEGGASFTGEISNRRKDGSVLQMESVISPMRNDRGAITSYVSVSRDITRERLREAALTRLAKQRELIASALAVVRLGSTPEETATSICGQLARLDRVVGAGLYYFGHDGLAVPLALLLTDGADLRARVLPVVRAQALRDRAQTGPWAETWVNRPWHPHNKLFTELGVTALAFAPILDQGTLVGLLEIATDAADGVAVLTDLLPALLEFAGLAGALVGPSIADLTEVGSVRDRVESIVRDGAFLPVFQPIVDVMSGAHVGYEALTRFTSGTAPDLVFASARRVELANQLELATLANAIEAAAVLPKDAWLSLNVSPDLVMAGPGLGRLLRLTHRPTVLEITEHVPITDYVALVDTVRRIRPKVTISVDDAGAGVANFNHIVELHPAFVKLDISLIRGIDTDRTRQALVVGLLHFAKGSATLAIAEGVETAEELAMLKKLGVKLVQGYLVGRPAPAESWAELARARQI